MQAPCKDCMDRKVGCHSTCEKYIEYKKELSEHSKRRYLYLQENNDYWRVRQKWVKK